MKKVSSLIVAVVLISAMGTSRVQAGSSSWQKAIVVGTLLHLLVPPVVVVAPPAPPPVVYHPAPVVVSPRVVVRPSPVVVHPRVVVRPSPVVVRPRVVVRPSSPVVVYPARSDHGRHGFRPERAPRPPRYSQTPHHGGGGHGRRH